MDFKPGSRWCSVVCDTEVVVVKVPNGAVSLQCGGEAMVLKDHGEKIGRGPSSDHASGTVIGKRYVHDPSGLEVLAVKSGEGSLSVDGVRLTLKDAKDLPSSD